MTMHKYVRNFLKFSKWEEEEEALTDLEENLEEAIEQYESAMEAQRCTGIYNGDISKCAFGKTANKKEFIFLNS